MAAGSCLLLLLLPSLVIASHSPPGCKIRITSKGLDLGKGLARNSQSGKEGRWALSWGLCLCRGLPALLHRGMAREEWRLSRAMLPGGHISAQPRFSLQ